MIPIYSAIEKVANLTGGTTFPWKVLALTNDGPKPYVVKLFTQKHVDQTSAVAREVFGNVLAGFFGLNCPSPALIRFDDIFFDTLSDTDKKDLKEKDQRISFGSEFVEGAINFHKNTPRSILNRYEIDSIYSFDNLINNVDRNNRKPNILLKSRECFLIDHELSLEISEKTIDSFLANERYYPHFEHLFHRYLTTCKQHEKEEFFGTFEETIRFINFRKLDSFKDVLVANSHPVKDYEILMKYLTTIKNNSSNFVKMLKKQVS